jgi:hypothetical protein
MAVVIDQRQRRRCLVWPNNLRFCLVMTRLTQLLRELRLSCSLVLRTRRAKALAAGADRATLTWHPA